MNTPRVTIIIATYNYGRFLRTAVDSVRAQTMRDWECIVVDDASTDDTPAILEEAARVDTRIRFMRNERNMGVSAARNLALAEARGEYIQFLDADDAIPPMKLERQSDYLGSHPETAVVYSGFSYFTDAPDFKAISDQPLDEEMTGTGAQSLRRLLRGNIIRINTALTRAAALRQVGGFRAEFRSVEDWHLWMSIAAKGHQFAFLDDPSCNASVRVNPDGLSKDAPGMRLYRLPALQDILVKQHLGIITSLNVLLRYADVLLDMKLARREPVVMLPEGKAILLICAIPVALAMLPVWLLWRPFRGR